MTADIHEVGGGCPPLRIEHQIDGSVEGHDDCGPSCGVMAVAYGTCSAKRPSTEDMRKAMGVPSGFTTLPQIANGIGAFGVVPNRKQDAPWGRAVDALGHDGTGIVVGIDYGTVAEKGPRLHVGSFTGFHFVFATMLAKRSGVHQVKVFDPLARTAAWWPLWVLRDAAGDYAGAQGTFSGIIVRRP